MSEHSSTPDDHGDGDAKNGHDDHHAGSTKTYLLVFGALCVLTSASFLTYTDFWDNNFSPQAGWAFMMAISCTKAMLVILFFMHLLHEANWKYVLTIPSAFMSIFLVCMLIPDVGMRDGWISSERRRYMAVEKEEAKEKAKEPAKVEETEQHESEDSSGESG